MRHQVACSVVGTGDRHPYGKHFIEVIEVGIGVEELRN